MAKNKKADNQGSAVRRAKHGWILTVFFSILAVLWLYPIFLVAMNSLKKKGFITRYPFALPDHRSFFGIENFIKGVQKTNFFAAMGNSVIITVGSVAVIILCTSMCAWYITRVHNKVNSTIYMLCLFSMIVPFQMVMFSLSKLANMMHLSNPIGIILVYLGFGAGLAVFMFCGFVKSIPLEIEEAAMIDGCTPIQTFFPACSRIFAISGIITCDSKLSGVGSSFGKHERRQSGNGDPKLERRTKRTYSEPIYKGDKLWDAQLASIWVLPIPASQLLKVASPPLS